MVNTASMIAEEEYTGSRLGYEIGRYTRYGSEEYNEQWWPGAESIFSVTEWIFAGLFTVEVGINMLCHGRQFFKDPWDLMDLLVVICSDLVLLGAFINVPFKVKLFRLLRLAKLGRLVKLLRQTKGFDSLHLMTTALRGSVAALWWSFLLIFLMQTFFSLVLTFLIRYLYMEDDSSHKVRPETKLELFSYFGTYFRSMFTLFELTLANYPTISRFLIEELSELWLVPCIAYRFFMGVAVLGVLNGVFIQETFNAAKTDDVIMVRTKMRQANLHREKMTKLFKYADRHGAGRIGIKEFRSVMKHKSIQIWLASMDLDCTDADQLFHLISKGEHITVEELIHGIFRLKGAARSIDVKVLLQLLRSLPVLAQATAAVGPAPPTMVTSPISPPRLMSEDPKSEALEVAVAGELPIPCPEPDHRACGGSVA